MAQNLNKTKRRINSINSTKKITKAMELVASVKLKRFKNVMFQNEKYTNEIVSLVNVLLSNIDEKNNNEFLSCMNDNKSTKDLYIVISSNLGLCASYNNDIFKYVATKIDSNNSIIVPIGTKGFEFFKRLNYEINDSFVNLNEKIKYKDVVLLSAFIMDEFKKRKYRSIKLIYTKYINSIKFVPDTFSIFPMDLNNKTTNDNYPPIFDPNAEELIAELVPLYVTSVLYSKIIESQVSEQASRRTAMENANDNADELINELTIEYNKARQAAITQEINEVVAGQIGK